MRRRRKLYDVDELLAESLSCYDPAWHGRAAAVPADDDGALLAAVWLSWPGRDGWLATRGAARVGNAGRA